MSNKLKKTAILWALFISLSPCNAQARFLDNLLKDLAQGIEEGIQNTEEDFKQLNQDVNNAKQGNHTEKPFLVLVVAPRTKGFLKARDNELEGDLYRFLTRENFAVEPPWESIKEYSEQGLALSPMAISGLTQRLGYSSFGYLVADMTSYTYALKKRADGDKYLMKLKINFLFVPGLDLAYNSNIQKWSKTVKIEKTIDSRNFTGWEFLIYPQKLEERLKRRHSTMNVSKLIAEAFAQVYPSFPKP